MAQVPKPNQHTDLVAMSKVKDIPISDISVARLIDDGLLVLYREVKNLMILSTRGKLEPNDARDLRDHLKLLFELQARENESLRGLTDEQLKEKAQAALNETDAE
jgi:hypothetical protein